VIQWGVVHGHLIAYREGKGRIPGLEGVKKRLPPEHRDAFEQQIRPYLMQMAQPNFYFSFWD